MKINQKIIRGVIALILTLTAGGTGYTLASENSGADICVNIPAETIKAPKANSVKVIYSLDKKQNDKEIIALIDNANSSIYFAIYTFTLQNVADALVSAKNRGVDVRGIIDSGQSSNSYGAPITEKLLSAGIPLVTEKHSTGNGIMHIKLIVTDSAYAFGSYNWTNSATNINDEILEIGTDESLRQTYENILKKLFNAYKDSPATAKAVAPISVGTINYTEASKYIGETASVSGTLINAHTSKTGTVFLDFCKDYKSCPFSAVIFADDAKKFSDISKYVGKTITITGKISSYQDKAEIILSDLSQLKIN